MISRPEENRRDEFVERVSKALNAEAAALDGATRSRLNRARQSALATTGRNNLSAGRRWNWLPAGGLALASILVVVVWFDGYRPGGLNPEVIVPGPLVINPGVAATPSAGDLEVLMVDEDFELLHDLDFYNWLQSVPVRSGVGSVGQSSRGEGLG